MRWTDGSAVEKNQTPKIHDDWFALQRRAIVDVVRETNRRNPKSQRDENSYIAVGDAGCSAVVVAGHVVGSSRAAALARTEEDCHERLIGTALLSDAAARPIAGLEALCQSPVTLSSLVLHGRRVAMKSASPPLNDA